MGKQISFLKEPMEVKFITFHRANRQVYKLYKKFALKLIAAGEDKIGSKMIIERIRWESRLKKNKGETYKIDNNYTCHYARLFITEFPEHRDRFYFRNLRTY